MNEKLMQEFEEFLDSQEDIKPTDMSDDEWVCGCDDCMDIAAWRV